MFVLKRLPLTCGAIALVSVYSAVSQLRQQRRSAEVQIPTSYLPIDVQREIIRQFFDSMNFQDTEILNISLTCKYWHKIISEHPSWLKERLPYNIEKYDDEVTSDEDDEPNDQGIDFLGADETFSPKIAYFIIRRRILSKNESNYYQLTRFPSDPQRLKADQLYVPWSNHNLVQRPDTLWKFIKTVLIDPEWLYPFLIWRVSKRRKSSDPKNTGRVFSMAIYLFILLSILPFLDCFLFGPDALVSQVKAAINSENTMQYLLWHLKPWSFGSFLRTSLNLWPMQLLEIYLSVDRPIFFVRFALMLLLTLVSTGPLFRQLLMAGCALLLLPLFKVVHKDTIRIILTICCLAPWVYYAPFQSLFSVVTAVFLLDLFHSGPQKEAKSFRSIRTRFIGAVLVMLSNLI